MKIEELLAPTDALWGVRAQTKRLLLKELCRRAAATLEIDPEVVIAAILEREQLGSTGIGSGTAIPHARFENVHKAYGIFARLKKPIDFDSIDGQPVDLVFLLLLPSSSDGHQLHALALVARTLRSTDATRDARRSADSAELFASVSKPNQ